MIVSIDIFFVRSSFLFSFFLKANQYVLYFVKELVSLVGLAGLDVELLLSLNRRSSIA